MTSDKEDSTSPVWSPDGRTLAFFRRVDGKLRIRLLPLAGGESRALDTGKLEPTGMAFAPDGKRIAFTAKLADTDEEKRAKWASGGAVLYDRERKPQQIFVSGIDGAEPRQVTRGTDSVVDFRWPPYPDLHVYATCVYSSHAGHLRRVACVRAPTVWLS